MFYYCYCTFGSILQKQMYQPPEVSPQVSIRRLSLATIGLTMQHIASVTEPCRCYDTNGVSLQDVYLFNILL